MIKTNLPYKLEDMFAISENGAVVDMSCPNFPGVSDDKQLYTSLIFLRNTDFDVSLDFSSCTYLQKKKYLLLYMKDGIKCRYKKLSDAWIEILLYASQIEFKTQSFMNHKEITEFILDNKEYIDEILRFIASIPLYAMNRFTLNGVAYNTDEFSKSENTDISNNIVHLFKYNAFMDVFEYASQVYEPVFYEKIFTMDNNEFFFKMLELPFMKLLLGLARMSEEEITQFMTEGLEYE